MKTNNPTLASTVAYYDLLLQRYANFIVRNKIIAAELVKIVLEDQYDLDGLVASPTLRVTLKTNVYNRCICYKQVQIFDRPLIKVPINNVCKS